MAGKNEYCYIIYRKVKRKGFPFLQIEYASDIKIFLDSIDYLKLRLSFRFIAYGIIIDERLIRGLKLPFAFKYEQSLSAAPKLYRSDVIPPDKIDNLYSENIIMSL